MPPSSALRAASPLKGEAVECVYLAQMTASPSRGEAARKADEGDIDNKMQPPTQPLSRKSEFRAKTGSPLNFLPSPIERENAKSVNFCNNIKKNPKVFQKRADIYNKSRIVVFENNRKELQWLQM